MDKDIQPDPAAGARAKAGNPAGQVNAEVRAIGEIIRATRDLTAQQVEQILAHQRSHGVRFGEAAIALGLATPDDVLQALAEQFNYAYGTEGAPGLRNEVVVLSQPFGPQAEAIRALRAQLQMRWAQSAAEGLTRKRALAVISPSTGDDKTFFATNLAVALAQMGERTLIIDADLRGPRLDAIFGVERTIGLAGLLSGRRAESSVIKAVGGVPNLFVLPVGISPPNPQELIEGAAFGVLLHELLGKFTHVIVDTPALEYGADAQVIAARCGQALVVARKVATKVSELQDLVGALAAVNTTITGVVLNDH